jgi:hypothetical protein
MHNTCSRVLFAAAALVAAFCAQAQPVINNDPSIFTEHRGATSLWSEAYQFVAADTSVTPSGPGTTVSAVYAGPGTGPSYSLNFVAFPLFPDQYAIRVPYTGQTGQWNIVATDAAGTSTRLSHVLDDPRDLPLITGLSASGSLLTPHLSWNNVDALLYPSFCGGISFGACALGYDFYNYQVEVRLATGLGPYIFTSSGMPTGVVGPAGAVSPAPTGFNIPTGILQPNTNYLIGIRLIDTELERINSNGSFYSPLENRSVAYIAYSTAAIPEPETLALLLAGLTGLGFRLRRKNGRN